MRLCDFCALKPFALLAPALALASVAGAQDSVSATPGTPDALSSYDSSVQTTRYVVDLAPIVSSWGNAFAIAPIVKSSADPDPMFDTQLIGAVAVSPDRLENVTLPMETEYALWSTSGAGVNPALNAPAAPVSVDAFEQQFALGIADLSAGPTNAIGATVGRTGEPNRLYVTRTVGAVSRFSAGSVDNATISLGAIDADGLFFLRADAFNTDASSSPLLGDNVVSVDLPSRDEFINAILSNNGANFSTDANATDFLIDDSAVTLNTPALQPGADAAVALDFAGGLNRADASSVNTTTGHLATGIAAHRGNPSASTVPSFPGASVHASLAQSVTGGGLTDSINVFSLDASGNVLATEGVTLPSPVTDGQSFAANIDGDATFHQYLSQQSFRGANGQAAVGSDASGQTLVAATAMDPSEGEFLAVATLGSGGGWTVAAHQGKAVLDGPGGNPVGTLAGATPASISAPSLDELGNVYFVAAFDPAPDGPLANALIKAVNTSGGYELELLVKEGDSVTGVNSDTPYTIDRITLGDSDSLASGSFYSSSIMPKRDPGYTGDDPDDPRAFNGAAIGAQITYLNDGVPETYDALLYVAANQGTTPLCPGDCNGDGVVNFSDLTSMLFAFGDPDGAPAGCDANDDGSVNFGDLTAALFLFGPCP